MAAKPGERRLRSCGRWRRCLRIPRGDKVTTAALASGSTSPEAALYRHFASKAQMFEGLIEFIK
jgi:TetR/AcrR family transcriptional regulator